MENQAVTRPIHAYATPATPYVESAVTNDPSCSYVRSEWAISETDQLLDRTMQAVWHRLEALPQFDYVPSASPGWGTSDLIPRMFGCEFDYTADGGVLNRT